MASGGQNKLNKEIIKQQFIENHLHSQYKIYKYRPNNKFPGHTECYNMNLPINEIIELECQKR